MTLLQAISVNPGLCGQCGGCVSVCATNALYLSPSSLVIDDSLCTVCGDCVIACPVGALETGRNG